MNGNREYLWRQRAARRRRARRIRKIILVSIAAVVLFLGAVIISWAFDGSRATEETQAAPVESTEEPDPTTEPQYEPDLSKPSLDWGAEDSYLLAKIAMAEAEGEGVEGKAMVIMVVLNRVWAEGFPDSIEDAIFDYSEEKDIYQFSPVAPGGRWWTTEPDEECYEALRIIMVEKWDESEGALYFEATYNGEDTWHSENLEYIKTVGNHNFYK